MWTKLLLQINTTAEVVEGVEEEIVSTEETISVIDLLVQGGGFIMIPLTILSIIAVYIIVERLMVINKASKINTNFMSQIRDFIHDGKIDAAKALCASTNSPISRMIGTGVSRIGKPLVDIRESIENVGKLEVGILEKSLAMLATIAGVAPMIGFLGTVVGMINTFHEMSTSGNEIQVSDLAGGIMQALVTTAAGLVIGIVAYVGYNTLTDRIQRIINKMEGVSIEFMDVLNEPSH